MALLNTPLGNIGNVKPIENWAEASESESKLQNVGPQKRTEMIKNGIKTIIDEVDDKDKGVCRVISTYKVINKKVPRVVAERKKWHKFGDSLEDGAGPNVKTTYVTDEVQIQFLQNKSGESQEPDNLDDKKTDPMKAYASRGHCRICKADDHWSEMYQINDEETENAEKLNNKQPGTTVSGRYVHPYARGGDRTTLGGGMERRSDDFTCRVTNLPEDSETLDEDLRAMFGSIGRIERFYLARDKATNKPKGFAFITYSNRNDAEKAIERFSGYKMEHLILKVEWTKPSNN